MVGIDDFTSKVDDGDELTKMEGKLNGEVGLGNLERVEKCVWAGSLLLLVSPGHGDGGRGHESTRSSGQEGQGRAQQGYDHARAGEAEAR